MITYIDFDGVVFDTDKLLFDSNYYKAKLDKNFNKEKYVQNIDWYNLILNSEEINNAIKTLKELKKSIILTKVNSLNNEGVAKIRILRELEIKNNIILVPFICKKTDIVDAYGNVLVDDTVHNLDDWKKDKGIPIFFNKDNLDIDNWNNVNKEYKKIKSLEYLKEVI